tara:strand:+ start:15896 stop:16366 length:471 start_codon:yes stop_codon:yes gene_type:complete
METLLSEAVKSWKSTISDKGGHCPCCERWGRIYKRPINETMARAVIWLMRTQAGSGGWVDVPNKGPRWLVRSNQLPTLRWWGLVERLGTDDPDQKHSGLWRPTEKGILFAHGRIRVPKFAYSYNNDVVDMSYDELIWVHDCFGKKFSYAETMDGLL